MQTGLVSLYTTTRKLHQALMRARTEPENIQTSSKLDDLPRAVGLSTMDLVGRFICYGLCISAPSAMTAHLMKNKHILTIDTRRRDRSLRTPILSNAISQHRLAIVPYITFQPP